MRDRLRFGGAVLVLASAVGCGLTGGMKAPTAGSAGATAQRQIDTVRTFYIDSTPREVYSAYRGRDGAPVPHGIYRMWNDKGAKILEYECQDGKKQGAYRSWFPNGSLEMQSQYANDAQNGRATWWYESGQVEREETWVQGVQQGPVTLYYENGKVKYEGTVDQGQPNGVFHKYYPNGDPQAVGEYDHGKLLHENTDFKR